jgi:hypothetical protein
MSYLLDNLRFFKRKQGEFASGHGETRKESRDWENVYRARWQYDKIVRSTHGVNCTGSCSAGRIYVKKWPDHLGNPADRLPPHPAGLCPIMSPAAVRVAPVIPGISTAPTA